MVNAAPNDEARMTNDERMTKTEMMTKHEQRKMPEAMTWIRRSSLGFDSSFVIRHSSLPARTPGNLYW
jgi:hypothetical protein